MKRRHRWDIWAELLTLSLKSESQAKLRYQASLSLGQCEKHFKMLIALGLLEEKANPNTSAVKTTWKGKQWLRDYQNLLEFLEP